MNKTKLLVTFAVTAGAVLIALAFGLSTVQAQDPDLSGALATLAAATARAEQVKQSQSATRQANDALATRQASYALATRQANDARATSQALDAQATRQAIDATATAQEQSIAATSTSQAMAATSTSQAIESQAQSTRQAQSAIATREAYQATRQAEDRQERTAQAGEVFLYLALGLGFTGVLFILWRVYLALGAIAQNASKPAPPLHSIRHKRRLKRGTW